MIYHFAKSLIMQYQVALKQAYRNPPCLDKMKSKSSNHYNQAHTGFFFSAQLDSKILRTLRENPDLERGRLPDIYKVRQSDSEEHFSLYDFDRLFDR